MGLKRRIENGTTTVHDGSKLVAFIVIAFILGSFVAVVLFGG